MNRWQLNTKIKDLSDEEKQSSAKREGWSLSKYHKFKFIAGVDGCKSSDDVVKCESCLTTTNDTLKSSTDLLSFIDSKRKVLYIENRTPKAFASYELKYFQEARERAKVLHEKLEEASNNLTTTLS